MHALSVLPIALLTLAAGCSDAVPGVALTDVPDAAASDVVALDRTALDTGPTDTGPDAAPDVARDVVPVDVPAAPDAPDGGVGDTGPSTDGGQASDVPASDGGTAECIGRPSACVSGTAGGTCGDALLAPNCVGGSWRCPEGTIPVTSCACIGRPPGNCTCRPGGWVCGDAGL